MSMGGTEVAESHCVFLDKHHTIRRSEPGRQRPMTGRTVATWALRRAQKRRHMGNPSCPDGLSRARGSVFALDRSGTDSMLTAELAGGLRPRCPEECLGRSSARTAAPQPACQAHAVWGTNRSW